MKNWKIPSKPAALVTRSTICCTAKAHSGVCGDGFHTTVSPQTAATIAFQA